MWQMLLIPLSIVLLVSTLIPSLRDPSATKETFEGARGIKDHISQTHRSFKPQIKSPAV